MAKRYIVRLTDAERGQLQELVSKGKAPAYKIKHAHLLLKADAHGPGWDDEQRIAWRLILWCPEQDSNLRPSP